MRFADNRSKPFAGGDRLQIWKVFRMTIGQNVLHRRVLRRYFCSSDLLHMPGKFCVNQSHSNGVVWTKKVAYGLRNICCVFAA